MLLLPLLSTAIPISSFHIVQDQRQVPSEIRISKTDTLSDIANKIITYKELSIIIDGTTSSSPLDIEGSYSLEALLAQIRAKADYNSVSRGKIIIFYKKFLQEKTRPDYSLSELIFGLKEIKKITAPLIYKREHQIAITHLFDEAVDNLTPAEKAQADSGGVLIGSLNSAAKQNLLNAIDYHEIGPIYFSIARILPILEGLEKSSISSSPETLMLTIFPENRAESHRFPLFSSKNIKDKSLEIPLPYTSLTQYFAATSSTDRIKIPESLKDYKITILSKNEVFDSEKLKLLSELNKWRFSSNTISNPTKYSIAAPKNQPDLTLVGKALHFLPGNVYRMMTFPLVPEEPLDDIKKLIHYREAKVSVTNRMRVFSDESLLRVSQFLKKQPSKSEISYKDMPLEIKEAVVDVILMQSLVSLYNEIIRNSFTPNSYMVTPDKSLFIRTVKEGEPPSYTIKGPTGGYFSVRSALNKPPGQ